MGRKTRDREQGRTQRKGRKRGERKFGISIKVSIVLTRNNVNTITI